MAKTYNGWTALDSYPTATFTAPGGKQVYCANPDVAAVFAYIAEQWHDRIEPIAASHPDNWYKPRERHDTTKDGEWDAIGIHCWRPKNTTVGTGNLSNHRSASGMDTNGHLHHYEASCRTGKCYGPNGRPHAWVRGFTNAQVATLRTIRGEVGKNSRGVWIIRLGLDFTAGLRDGMHVEIAPGVTAQDVKAAAQKLRAIQGVEDLTAVAKMLAALNYPATKAGLEEYQHARRLTVDGIPGPITTAALEADMATLNEIAAEQKKQGRQLATNDKFIRQITNQIKYHQEARIREATAELLGRAVEAIKGGADAQAALSGAIAQAKADATKARAATANEED